MIENLKDIAIAIAIAMITPFILGTLVVAAEYINMMDERRTNFHLQQTALIAQTMKDLPTSRLNAFNTALQITYEPETSEFVAKLDMTKQTASLVNKTDTTVSNSNRSQLE